MLDTYFCIHLLDAREPDLIERLRAHRPSEIGICSIVRAERYGLIRAGLAAEGQPIAPNDAVIAAIARAHEAVLVTRNVREFSRVSGLQIEAW